MAVAQVARTIINKVTTKTVKGFTLKSLHFISAYAITIKNMLRQITKGEIYYDCFLRGN